MRLLAISWKVFVLGSYLSAIRVRSLLVQLYRLRTSRRLVERKRVEEANSSTFSSFATVQQNATMSEDFLGTFEVVLLKKHLEDCLKTKEGQIHLQSYCRVFKQLYKFFCLLGTVFGFVGSDVKSKVEILEAYLQDDRGNKYETVEKMVNHEIEEDIVNTNKDSSGSRTFLRLHRSLIFVSQFLESSLRIDPGDSTAGIAKTAYDNTLAKYHPWLVKKGAHLAMYTLPTKKDLYIKVSGSNIEKGDIDALVTEVIALTQKIYDQCDKLYHAKDLHSLP